MNKGLSGCTLELVDEFTIRKTSTTSTYNARLRSQMGKQQAYLQTCQEFSFKSPRITAINEAELFSYDMQYIPSSSFTNFFADASKDDLDHFYAALTQYLNGVRSDDKDCADMLVDKLQTLLTTTSYRAFIQFIICEAQHTSIILPIGFCHGDLTLSNILFKHREYYLIDFLDSHIETPYYDLAKLKQDLYYGWSLRVNGIDNLRVRQGIDYVWSLLYYDRQTALTSNEFKFIDALTLLRIEPYITDPTIGHILQQCIYRLELYEQFTTAHGG